MNRALIAALLIGMGGCATTPVPSAHVPSTRDGRVEYAGAQNDLFTTGKAEAVVSVSTMARAANAFGVGAVEGLDGEVTVFNGKAFVTQMRGGSFSIEGAGNHGVVFAVWTQQSTWRDEPVPSEIRGYVDLQNFVKQRAAMAGIDVTHPFAFQLTGEPVEVKWHVNVDHTEGKPITPELFSKSKENFVAKHEAMDIIGFYSENHPGVFISAFAPAIPKDGALKNAIHMHLVSRDGKLAGHIDNIVLGPGMTLRLPAM